MKLRIAGVTFFALIMMTSMLSTVSSQTSNQPLSPRQQWKNIDDISQITCKEGLVLLEKANGAPACVSPNAYLRLVDRGWGMWDSSIMTNRPNMMQEVMGHVVRDPNLSQQLHSMIQQNQNLWYDVSPQLKQDPQVLQNMMMPMMNDPQSRQQMIEMMQQNPQMMQSVRNNNMMMGMIQGNMPLPSSQTPMGDHMMNQGVKGPMMGQKGQMGGSMMGQNMMGQGMMEPMMNQGMMMHNPQMMNSMMNQMMNNPQTKTMMQNMMMQNQYHMQAMIDQGMVGPMLGPMMNDPQLQQEMLDLMMQHRDMMMNLRQNQQFMNSLNQP